MIYVILFGSGMALGATVGAFAMALVAGGASPCEWCDEDVPYKREAFGQ